MTEMGVNGGIEVDDEEKKKKINENLMAFLRKQSETNAAPRYTARLKTYVDLQQKRLRAAAARRHSEQILKNERSAVGNKNDDKTLEATENRGSEEDHEIGKGRGQKKIRSHSRSRSKEPSDRCGCKRRRRRRSGCRRRRRRRRSCRRRRSRRRSCSRRRRRRSCRRRRKRRRRRRC